VGIVFPHTIFPWDINKEKWGGGKKSPLVGLAKIMRWGVIFFLLLWSNQSHFLIAKCETILIKLTTINIH